MFNVNRNLLTGDFGHVRHQLQRTVYQDAYRPLRMSRDWRSALLYLLPPLLILVRLTLFIRRRAGTDFTVVDTHAGVQAVLVMITCAVLVTSRQTRIVVQRLCRMSIGMLLLFYGFAGLSAVWSAIPQYSAYRALEFISQFLAIVVGFSCFTDFTRAERAALMLGLLVAFLGAAGTATRTNFATLRTNNYAAGASMVICYCFAEMPRAGERRRSMLVACGLMGFVFVAAGMCATTNVATFAGLLAGAVLTRNRAGLILALVLVILVMLTPGLAGDFQETAKSVLFPGKSNSQIYDLHGRVQMWEAQLAVARRNPLIGHGFAVQSRLQGTISAHNAWVQVFLDTGIIGLIVFSASILMFVGEATQRWRITTYGLPGYVAAFISVFVHCIAGNIVGAQWLVPSFAFAAFAGLYVNHIHPHVRSSEYSCGADI